MRELWPHQQAAIDAAYRAVGEGCRRLMIQIPTGGGKTTVASTLTLRALAKGRKVIFTVPAVQLVDQAAQEFFRAGIRDIGVMQADHPMTDMSKPVQIASIQTLQRRFIPPADLVLVDEAHRQFEWLTNWMGQEDWAHVTFIGLSATPWSRGLGRLYDRLIIAATTKGLIAEKLLSPFEVYAPSKPDLSGVETTAGDYNQKQLSGVMGKRTLVADVVETWIKLGEGRPTICFAVDRIHAKTLQQQFETKSIGCGYLDQESTRKEREDVRVALANGAISVVCNVGVLTTGVDWDVRCIILARPTKSEILFCQMVGRGLRIAPGKQNCRILDHSTTTLNLGFVTDIHHTGFKESTLSSRQDVEKKTALPKECPRCHHVRAPQILECPACGYLPELTSSVQTEAGELVSLADARRSNRQDDWPEKVIFIRQLRAYALERNLKDAWVSWRYKAKYGVWPNDPRVRYADPAAGVSREVRSWITSQNIRHAKGRHV